MDEARFRQIMDELEADAAYARGERPLPFEVTADEAMFILEQVYDIVDQGTAARERKCAESGLKMACAPGCAWCCEQPILIWLPEAMLVARFLERPENAEARARFLEKYPAWRAAVGDSHEKVAEAGTTGVFEDFQRAHLDAWRRRVRCAFNHEGLCTVYAARPLVCRHYHALDTAEHCKVDDPQRDKMALAKFPPLDQLVGRVKRAASGLHHAIGGEKMRMVSLCEAVYRLITETGNRQPETGNRQ